MFQKSVFFISAILCYPSPDLSHLFLVFLYALLALSMSTVPLLLRCKFTSYGPVDFYFSSIAFNPAFLYLVLMGGFILLFYNSFHISLQSVY